MNLPGGKLRPLKGEHWSVWVSGNWRQNPPHPGETLREDVLPWGWTSPMFKASSARFERKQRTFAL